MRRAGPEAAHRILAVKVRIHEDERPEIRFLATNRIVFAQQSGPGRVAIGYRSDDGGIAELAVVDGHLGRLKHDCMPPASSVSTAVRSSTRGRWTGCTTSAETASTCACGRARSSR